MTMKKRTVSAVTAGVWIAALGSAAALIYELNRPLHEVGYAAVRWSPLASAMFACGWLALVSAVFAWRWSIPLVRSAGVRRRTR
jgi:hypothetical protein